MAKQIPVVGAVIVEQGRVLCAQRALTGVLPGLWEFPGGKIEPGETPAQALAREIIEELGCVISVGDQIVTTTHEYEFGIVTLTTFYCTIVSGVPTAHEHAALSWLRPTELSAVPWAPADLPALERILADLA